MYVLDNLKKTSRIVALTGFVVLAGLSGNAVSVTPSYEIMRSHPCYDNIQDTLAEALRNGVYKEALPEIQVAIQQCSIIADLDRGRKMIKEAIESVGLIDQLPEDLETSVENSFETLNAK